ncbi:hypothetical protein BJ742DRAFT_680726 [Cladochytrium replicatum]|nr:hypothetical protein BJ742DRAFT_680726 [Cladochytrium replicatum]
MTAEGGEELDFSPNGVFFLGASYDDVSSTELLDDLKSRIWITYRHSFPPIQPSTFTTDVGWGCMLRSGQMLLANSFIVDRLGRDWRISKNTSPQMWSAYIEIVSWFLDSNSSPYSIHRIALLGKQFEKEIGQWFGPTTISQVLKVLVNNEASSSLSIYVGNDGVLYTDEIRKELDRPLDRSDEPGGSTFVNGAANRRSVLILMPLRLGVDNLNPIYYNGLKQCLAISNCVGIAGGRPNSSLFFVGVHGENLLYLDPHYSRPGNSVRFKLNTCQLSLSEQDFASFHCHTVRSVPLSSIDPSLVIGFYIRDIFDLDRFCSLAGSVREFLKGSFGAFSVSFPPDYARTKSVVFCSGENASVVRGGG